MTQDPYRPMKIARRVRMVLLIGFVLFMAWEGTWLLAAVGVGLIALTIWQNKKLEEHIAERKAAGEPVA